MCEYNSSPNSEIVSKQHRDRLTRQMNNMTFRHGEQEALDQSNTHCMRAGWWREVLAIFWDEGVQLQG